MRFAAQSSQNLFLAALFLTAGTHVGAALSLSALFIASLLPSLLFALPSGALVDRLGAAKGLMLGAGIRLATVGAAAAFVPGPRWGWVAMFVFSTGSQLFSPAEMSMVRSLSRRSSGSIHSVLVALQYGGQAFGVLVLAPICYYGGGSRLMFGTAFVGTAVVAATSLIVSWGLRGTPASFAQPARAAFRFRPVARLYLRDARTRYALVALSLKVIVLRAIVVTLPLYVRHDIGLGFGGLVVLAVPAIVGCAIGLFWAARTVNGDSAVDVMRLSMAGMAVATFALGALAYALLAATNNSRLDPIEDFGKSFNMVLVVGLPVAFLLGLSMSGILVSGRVALTEAAPISQQARVWAVQMVLTEALIVVPVVLVGVMAEMAGARSTLTAIGALVGAALLLLELPALLRRRSTTSPVPLPVVVPAEV